MAQEMIFQKRGQMALWAIVAVAIVSLIILLFVFGIKPTIPGKEDIEPSAFIESCTREAVQGAIDVMLPQGGFLAPENYKRYRNINIAYLCENKGYFKPCINQHPLLHNEIHDELFQYTMPRVEVCFNDMKKELEKRNYAVELEPMQLNISIGPITVKVHIERKTTITKREETRIFSSFDIAITSPLYELSSVASDIVNQEAKYCYFEYVGYMLLYPRYHISVSTLSDSTRIYTIRDKHLEKEINIAIRGCVIPPGI